MLLYVPSEGATSIAVLYSNMVLESAYGERVSSVGLVGRKRTKKTTGDRDSGSEENRERACRDVNYSADIPTHGISIDYMKTDCALPMLQCKKMNKVL